MRHPARHLPQIVRVRIYEWAMAPLCVWQGLWGWALGIRVTRRWDE